MVNVLVAPDKFKGSLTAQQVCQAVVEGLSGDNKFSVTTLPMADGGEGTFEVLLDHFKGRTVSIEVHDPLMRKIQSSYGVSNDGTTAFIEMAKASGLQLLNRSEQNPLHTTSYGTGELISDALFKGATNIVLGIGGSATNDGGVGMASALGFTFFHNEKFFNPLGGKDLIKITRLDPSLKHPQLSKVKFITLCDVSNPLTGPNGAAHVYAAQKGASPDDIIQLEKGLIYLQKILKDQFNFSADFKGAGAAGGLGAGAKFFLNSEIMSGMEYLSKVTSLDEQIRNSDVVITGEGKVDLQSLSGKVVHHVAQLASAHGKKVIVLCGLNDLSRSQLFELGITECLVLARDSDSQNAMRNAFALVKARLKESKVLFSR